MEELAYVTNAGYFLFSPLCCSLFSPLAGIPMSHDLYSGSSKIIVMHPVNSTFRATRFVLLLSIRVDGTDTVSTTEFVELH